MTGGELGEAVNEEWDLKVQARKGAYVKKRKRREPSKNSKDGIDWIGEQLSPETEVFSSLGVL